MPIFAALLTIGTLSYYHIGTFNWDKQKIKKAATIISRQPSSIRYEGINFPELKLI